MCVIRGTVARKTRHRYRPGTAEPRIESGAGSASPLGEGEAGRPRGRWSTSAWLVHRGSHPHPSPLPQGCPDRRHGRQVFGDMVNTSGDSRRSGVPSRRSGSGWPSSRRPAVGRKATGWPRRALGTAQVAALERDPAARRDADLVGRAVDHGRQLRGIGPGAAVIATGGHGQGQALVRPDVVVLLAPGVEAACRRGQVRVDVAAGQFPLQRRRGSAHPCPGSGGDRRRLEADADAQAGSQTVKGV